jgi:hypothetical protein
MINPAADFCVGLSPCHGRETFVEIPLYTKESLAETSELPGLIEKLLSSSSFFNP